MIFGEQMRDDVVLRLLDGQSSLETSKFLDRLMELSTLEEAEHQFLVDPFDRSVALVFQMFQSSDLDPWDVDLSSFIPSEAPTDPCTLLFVGVMNYFPNTDGVTYFVREVLPAIRAVHPDVRLKIVGMNPPEAVKLLGAGHIEVTGVVDDPRPYLDSSTVVIVPLRVGGGTRFKIVEAMAKGKPIVSTRIGAEGIEVSHDRELLLADDADSFAREVGRLLTDPELAKRLGRAGRQLAEQRYSWESALTRLEAFYGEL